MTNFITSKCPNCGANVEIKGIENGICKYCGSTIVLEEILKDFMENSENIKNVKKFIEIKEYENALNLVKDILKENPLDNFALIYEVKIMIYLFDFNDFNSQSADFDDKDWITLKSILKKYDRVCKINKSVPKEFNDVKDKIEILQKWDNTKNKENDICDKISEKLNTILNNYKMGKNNLLIMLKDKIGLVTGGRTVSKLNMMKESQSYEEEIYDKPFPYRIGDRVLDRFEYKRDGSVELTYKSNEEGVFSIEYYGKIIKYSNLEELLIVLDEIIADII